MHKTLRECFQKVGKKKLRNLQNFFFLMEAIPMCLGTIKLLKPSGFFTYHQV